MPRVLTEGMYAEASKVLERGGWTGLDPAAIEAGLPGCSIMCLNAPMHAAVTAAAGAGHPAVAAVLGLAAAGLAGGVVAMAWSVHARQIRLAGQLARRQLIVTAETGRHGQAAHNGRGPTPAAETNGAARAAPAPVTIDGPDTLVAGEQARYRVQAAGGAQAVWWGVGGGPVAHAPDPAHPQDLLLIADQPGDLVITARIREGMAERRATKPVTAVADVADPAMPFPLRLFLHGWGLAAVAVLIIGFGGALVALGSLPSSDFIALAAPLAALLTMATARQWAGGAVGRPGQDRATTRPRP